MMQEMASGVTMVASMVAVYETEKPGLQTRTSS
jgi:hypothetical protein